MVNLKGDRFCNDYWPDYTKMAQAMLEQPEGKSFVIIDGKSMKASKRLQSFLKSGYFVEAQTIPELAQKIGIPPENLEKTIKRYAVGELTYDSGTPHGVWSGRRAAEHILSK